LRRIALRCHALARLLGQALAPESAAYFDTLSFAVGGAQRDIRARALEKQVNLRWIGEARVGVSVDETTTPEDIADLAFVLTGGDGGVAERARALSAEPEAIPPAKGALSIGVL
jgi:glycine dehydrogenase